MPLKPTNGPLALVYETLRRTVQGSRGANGTFEPGPRETPSEGRQAEGGTTGGADSASGDGRGGRVDIKI